MSLEETKVTGSNSEVKPEQTVSDTSRLKNGFYDKISFESEDRKLFN